MRLEGNVAIVTGGGSGIGAAAAKALAREGAKVAIFDVDEAGGSEVARAIEVGGGTALFARTDVSNEAEVRENVARVAGAFGGVDVLVNNAAIFVMKGLEATADEWRRCFEVNCLGTIFCSKYAVAEMKKRGRGAIVNLGSISSFIAQPGLMVYSATKAALVQITKNMACDLARHNIRVNVVCPGPIWTPALEREASRTFSDRQAFEAEENEKMFLGRVGEASEVAEAIMFLASSQASYITATPLMVDGGYIAR